MKALNSRVPDLTVVGAAATWIGTHLAQLNIAVQIIAGAATFAAMIAARRYHRLKRVALERWLASDGSGAPP